MSTTPGSMKIDQSICVDLKSADLKAVIIRADGTIEDLGVVSSWRPPQSKLAAILSKIPFLKG